MKTTVVLALALASAVLAQAPGGTPPPAGFDPDLGWYRLTHKGIPVGFMREEWKEESFAGKNSLHYVASAQFMAKPDILRDLPYSDFKIDAIVDAQNGGLQLATYLLFYPLVPTAAGGSEFKVVEAQVQFMVERQTIEGKTSLLFTSTTDEFQDVKLSVDPGDDYVIPDAIPRILAQQLRAGKSFTKKSVVLHPGLAVGRSGANYIAALDVVVKERIPSVKIGEDDVPVWPVLLIATGPDGVPMTDVCLLDDKGIVRKTWTTLLPADKIQYDADPTDTVVATRVLNETDAHEGLTFVLSSKMRRDPFVDPRAVVKKDAPKAIGGTPTPTATEGPKPPVGPPPTKREDIEKLVQDADNCYQDMLKTENRWEKASQAERDNQAKNFQKVVQEKAQVDTTNFLDLKAKVAKTEADAKALMGKRGGLQVGQAKALLKNIEDAFKNEETLAAQRVLEITGLVDKCKAILAAPGAMTPADIAEVQRIVHDGEKYILRAKKLVDFANKMLEIVGLLYHFDEVNTPLTVGIVLFGRAIVLETTVPLPKSKSSVTLRAKGSKEDHSYTEGDRVLGGGDLTVKRIERNRVVFEYEQEEIGVQTH